MSSLAHRLVLAELITLCVGFCCSDQQCACADGCVNGAICVGAESDGTASGICTPFDKNASSVSTNQVRQNQALHSRHTLTQCSQIYVYDIRPE